MAKITPSANHVGPQLEDDTSYKATLVGIEWSVSSPEYGSERRLQLDWLPEGCEEYETVRDWISLRLGKQQNGTVSKLRQLLNAIAGKPSGTDIKWFDDETLEISWSGEGPEDQLTTGREVILEGVNGTKADGSPKFSVARYKRLPTAAAAAPATRRSAPQPVGAVVDVNPDDIPF